jgi:hypothetical protein
VSFNHLDILNGKIRSVRNVMAVQIIVYFDSFIDMTVYDNHLLNIFLMKKCEIVVLLSIVNINFNNICAIIKFNHHIQSISKLETLILIYLLLFYKG